MLQHGKNVTKLTPQDFSILAATPNQMKNINKENKNYVNTLSKL